MFQVINDRKQQFVETLEDDTQIIEKKGNINFLNPYSILN